MILEGKEVKYFSPEEFERIDEMWAPLIWELDRLRGYTGKAIHVNESNPIKHPGSSHMPDSLHYHGRAVDVYCEHMALWDFFLAATRFPFTGIGVYPAWNRPGLHLEISSIVNPIRKYWWRDVNGAYRAISVYDLSTVFKTPLSFET
jgi:uncharacterized protein YcbK (DUF882 family)